MRKFLVRFVSHLKANAPILRLVFLLGALAYILYVGAWYTWRGYVSNTPGFILIMASFPWSLPWLSIQHYVSDVIAWPIRNVITSLVVALGFGFNCALVGAIAWFVVQSARNTSVKRDAQTARPLS